MTRWTVAASVLLAWPAYGQTPAADPIDAAATACLATPAGQTTSGMAECSHQAYLAYDRQLNEVYQAALRSLDPASAALVREAQRRWVALQEADEAADNAPWRRDRGSLASPDLEALRVDAIRQRIAKLRYYGGTAPDGNAAKRP